MRVIIRMWTEDGYHKDVVVMSEQQIHMHCGEVEAKGRHIMVGPVNAVRAVIDPKEYPEAIEFEVIIDKSRS